MSAVRVTVVDPTGVTVRNNQMRRVALQIGPVTFIADWDLMALMLRDALDGIDAIRAAS